jgi:uncharacterized protein
MLRLPRRLGGDRSTDMKRLLGILLLGSSMGAADAASFDCAKAHTPQEKAICASPELSKADDRMAAAYKAALAAAPPEFQNRIRDAQRAWIRRITLNCLPGNPYRPLDECLHQAYDTRTHTLDNTIVTAGGVKFTWTTISFTVPDSPEDAENDKQRGASPVATFDASWPQALSTSPEWQAWNTAVEDDARDLASQGKAGSDRRWRPEWADGLDTDLETTLGLVTPRLVTATLSNEWYGHGAAHPNTNSLQLNWMLKERRALQAEDVFRAGSGWQQILYDRTDKYLHSVLDQDAGGDYQSQSGPRMIAETLHKIVEDPQSWTIDAKGITIVFQQYAVACRACTPDPFTLTWDSLKPILNPEFEIPGYPNP